MGHAEHDANFDWDGLRERAERRKRRVEIAVSLGLPHETAERLLKELEESEGAPETADSTQQPSG